MKALKFAHARVTVECTAPFTVGTGRGDDLVDSICVTDANGLPTIPGSSLAGVLRHALFAESDGDEANALFGYQKENLGDSSRVKVSWAQVHGIDDRPVAARMDATDDAAEDAKAFRAFLEGGVLRDHVRINARGAVDGAGKFDEKLVPRGARFTFELRVEARNDRDDVDAELGKLLGALTSPTFRLGGRTRRGYGAFRLVRAFTRTFDLKGGAKDYADYTRLPRALDKDVPVGVLTALETKGLKPVAREGIIEGRLTLRPEDFWLFGNGDAARDAHKRGTKDADMIPKTEPVIDWSSGRGVIVEGVHSRNLVQSAGIKGALRHRAAFHHRRLKGQWAEGAIGEAQEPVKDGAIVALFGVEKSKTEGVPGNVSVSDAYLTTSDGKARADANAPRDGALDHVSIDRFTGAPMDGMLFREVPLYQGSFEVTVRVDTRAIEGHSEGSAAREAFKCALDDLCEGRLAVGAGANRGHGYVKGVLSGALKRWLDEGG